VCVHCVCACVCAAVVVRTVATSGVLGGGPHQVASDKFSTAFR
jgi:hypothetical protein